MSDTTTPRETMECGGYRFFCRNPDEFTRICHDVFTDHEYDFSTRRRTPFIIDAGAHVGVATHFFKRRYPFARVLALEANPVTFGLLQRNVALNRLSGVEAVQAALAPQEGEIPFYTSASDEEPGAWGDSAIRQEWHEGPDLAVVSVPARTLSSLLTRRVDLLKLDIEGLETAVLAEASPQLARVRRVILEFHGTQRNPENTIGRLVEILGRARFRVEVRQFGAPVRLSAIQKDDPYWLTVRAERPNLWQQVFR